MYRIIVVIDMAIKIRGCYKTIKVSGETENIFVTSKAIGRAANKGNDTLKEVELIDDITTVSESAFEDCTSLTTVTLPPSLKRIEQNAFIGCTALQKVVTSDSLDEVDCWLGNRGVAKLTLFNPSSDELVNYLKQGYAMDFHYKGESRGDHWA